MVSKNLTQLKMTISSTFCIRKNSDLIHIFDSFLRPFVLLRSWKGRDKSAVLSVYECMTTRRNLYLNNICWIYYIFQFLILKFWIWKRVNYISNYITFFCELYWNLHFRGWEIYSDMQTQIISLQCLSQI